MTLRQNPVLSVVVAIVSDTTEQQVGVGHLAGCLQALSSQVDISSMEIIVPHLENVNGIEGLQKQFPHVTFVPVRDLKALSRNGGSREHHDTLRARGISAAQGDLIALVEDHSRPDGNWCANIISAHQASNAAIGGAIENGIDRRLNWAVYYCDFGKYENPLPSGESPYASDANVSYKRSALESIRTTWEQSFREVIVNGALMSRGERIVLRSDIIVYQHRSDLQLGCALRERFIWGRSYAAARSPLLSNSKRIVYAALSPLLPAILILRMTLISWKRRRHFGEFLRAFHLITMLQICWSLGEGVGYLKGVSTRSTQT